MRHSWVPKGHWSETQESRRCEKCGVEARKSGMMTGWTLLSPDDDKWYWKQKMPPCEGAKPGREPSEE